MKKKLLAALLATAMTVTMFAGCGTAGDPKIPRKMTAVLHQERRELLTHFVKTFLLWIHRTVTLSHVQQQKSAPMRC